MTKAKSARGVAEEIKHLPSKHEDLSSSPSTTKKILYKDEF
jgi:hypothetical protein